MKKRKKVDLNLSLKIPKTLKNMANRMNLFKETLCHLVLKLCSLITKQDQGSRSLKIKTKYQSNSVPGMGEYTDFQESDLQL